MTIAPPFDTLPIDGTKTGLTTDTNGIDPVRFTPPLLNPTGFGLFAAVGDWQNDPDNRFLHGVDFRALTGNYGGETASGVWQAEWCGLQTAIAVTATGGTFDVTVDGQTAAANAYNITANNLKTALEALSTLVPGDVVVTLPVAGTYVLTFPQRRIVTVNGASLTGPAHAITLTDETKFGTRPPDLDPFDPITVWSYAECDMTEPSRIQTQARAQQILRLEEQTDVEREFAARLLLDANDLPGSIQTVADLRLAVGYLEAQMALTNTLGYFHVGAQWAAVGAGAVGLVIKSGTRWVSPLGHIWVIGGGYVDGLDSTIVATSQPFGWRSDVFVQTALDTQYHDVFAAVAERSVLVGYEHCISAVTIT